MKMDPATTNVRIMDHRRLLDCFLFAWLTNSRTPTNRAECRAQVKRLRRIATVRRGVEREIQEKRAFRAWRKERRLARAV